ncbi:MAG: D-alanyl-D-alanine carboxypeptidase family protein [Actinomycetota bacterium]
MTLISCGISCLLALLSAGFAVQLSHVSTLRFRAQTAADSAALAAVAESSAYGGGLHEKAARTYAHANGAELLECLCQAGATAAQVRVEVEGVTAEARAVLDPEAIVPAPVPSLASGMDHLHPSLERALRRLIQAAAGRLRVVSGYRSTARQTELWEQALARYGSAEAADDWVARPGTSMHERGLAVDLAGDLDLAVELIRRLVLPLYRPLPNEPWHFELLGG